MRAVSQLGGAAVAEDASAHPAGERLFADYAGHTVEVADGGTGALLDRGAQNLLVEGPTGVGESWLSCALGDRARRDNHSVLYQRIPRLFADPALARGDGRYARLMRALGGVKLLILDDWGSSRSGPSSAATCWRSSRTATAAAQP